MVESLYVGMWGTYAFCPRDNTALFGEYFLTVDWVQIRNGKHLQAYPDRYKITDYVKQPWLVTALEN